MKSCIQWRKSSKFLSEIDQFNIDFKDKKRQLIQFLDIFAISQRVNIRVSNTLTLNQIQLLIALKEQKNYNIAICFSKKYSDENESAFNIFITHEIPCYFYDFIDNWDEFTGYCNLGVSDIYITGQLGFDLERAAAIAHQKNIQLRCYANICQSRWSKNNSGLKAFFIRPQDRQIYEGYIDVLQFNLKKEDLQQQEVLYQMNKQAFAKEWEKYATGSYSSWEMEVMCLYDHEHELAHANKVKYGISNYVDLPEEPIVESLYRGRQQNRRFLIKFLKFSKEVFSIIMEKKCGFLGKRTEMKFRLK